MKNKVKFKNDNTLTSEGIDDVTIMRKDNKKSVISNVLYMPGMKINFLSIWQLIEKNYNVFIKAKMMRVLDSGARFILKAPMSQNRAFNIELNLMEHKCLENTTIRDEWL